jgi:N-acetyl-anhydromuramyl-L-alanine amidase AmpD
MVNVTRTLAHKCKLPTLGTPTIITYHCADTPEGRDDKAEKIVGMDMVRFKQPSYHFVVELDGSVVQCLKLTELGAHVGQHNHHNIGVCYVGGRGLDGKTKDTRTQAQKASLRRIDAELKAAFKTITVSKGHRDWSPDLDHDGKVEPHEWLKMCPCFDVATQL